MHPEDYYSHDAILFSPTSHQEDTLIAQLSILQAVTLATRPMSQRVMFKGLHMTRATMEALRGLPAWSHRVDLAMCVWPLEPAEYTRLAQCIPHTYTSWDLHGVQEAVLDSSCAGVKEHRERGKKLRICRHDEEGPKKWWVWE